MNPISELKTNITRRYFFQQGSHAIGWAALASLMGGKAGGAERACAREHRSTAA